MVRTTEISQPNREMDEPFSVDRSKTTLRCRSLTKSFGPQTIVHDVSFTVPQGELMALVGPSGCGKTTTLRLIAGFEQLDGGAIEIDGQVVADGNVITPPEKRRVGMVFQDYAVFPHLSVGRNIGFALGRGEKARERITELLDFVGLPGQQEKMPHELSGGEQQRVSLARALSMEPAVLLLDEPFSNLDAALRSDVRAEVRHLLKQNGITAVFVTHDQEEALYLGDTVGVMRDGRLEQLDTPEAIFHQPQTRFVAEFLGQTDFLPGTSTSRGIVTPLGLLPRVFTLPEGAPVEVVVRPENVQLQVDEHGNGRILSRQFTGMAYLYTVVLMDGTILHSRQPYTMILSEGTVVSAALTAGPDLPCFYGDKAL
jgi:iron(III) transport system ATP-binding protein